MIQRLVALEFIFNASLVKRHGGQAMEVVCGTTHIQF